MNEVQGVRPEYLLVDEVSELLRTPVATIYAWRHRGEGPPAVRIGRKLLFKRADVEAWVEAQAVAS